MATDVTRVTSSLGGYGYGGWRDIQGKLREERNHVDVHVLIDITLTRKDL